MNIKDNGLLVYKHKTSVMVHIIIAPQSYSNQL